jgi:hypothetical protein
VIEDSVTVVGPREDKEDDLDSKKDIRSEANSASDQTSQTSSVSHPTPNSGPNEVGDEVEHGNKESPWACCSCSCGW